MGRLGKKGDVVLIIKILFLFKYETNLVKV